MRNIKYLISGLLLSGACMSCSKTPKQDLIANYESKQLEINQLYAYVNDITADNKYFRIEFEDDKKIEYFFVTIKRVDSLTGQTSYTNIVADGDYNRGFIGNRNLDIDSQSVDNLLNWLGWTRDKLNTLKQKLNDANCISVESGAIEFPMTIGYKRAGLGMYFYNIFNQSLSDSLKNKYNDGCRYIFYKDNIVLEYRGGAIGSQCF